MKIINGLDNLIINWIDLRTCGFFYNLRFSIKILETIKYPTATSTEFPSAEKNIHKKIGYWNYYNYF